MSRRGNEPYCDFCEKTDGPFISGGKEQDYHICRKCTEMSAGLFGIKIILTDASPLTRRQSLIYDYLERYIHLNGYAPSYEEIAAYFKYNSLATVHEHLHNLERKGWITVGYNQARAVTCLVRRVEVVA